MGHRVIYLQPLAPLKPAIGGACNGCGVCCAWQPCPLGMLVSARFSGACRALLWDGGTQRYQCAMVWAPQAVWPRLPAPLRAPLTWLARRWIAAGAGCDSELDVQRAGHEPA